MEILGIDIGGSGIKGAPVNTQSGELLAERFRVPTPDSAKPHPMAKRVAEIVAHFDWKGLIGCGFPTPLRAGVALTAANIHSSWIGTDVPKLFNKATDLPVVVINDADAAGLAEMRFGAGRGREKGVVLMLTLGTGIGSAIFIDGRLLPNTEFGHLKIRGKDAEWRASDAARQRKGLTWEQYGKRLNEVLQTLEGLLWPDLIIIGGGISKDYQRFFPFIKVQAEIVPAQMQNLAGIVGAALAAEMQMGS